MLDRPMIDTSRFGMTDTVSANDDRTKSPAAGEPESFTSLPSGLRSRLTLDEICFHVCPPSSE